MKKQLILTLTIGLVISAMAQTPSNVEKAVRYRVTQNASQKIITHVPSLTIPATQTTFASRELSSRYITGIANAAQLDELGSRYAVAISRNAAIFEAK